MALISEFCPDEFVKPFLEGQANWPWTMSSGGGMKEPQASRLRTYETQEMYIVDLGMFSQ